jgi:hypothetical protein
MVNQMAWKAGDILSVLDSCCENFTFPMLDNGYYYLAATRMSLYRSTDDWAIVIEVFGFSPRAGMPDTHVATFASKLRNRMSRTDYATEAAYANHLSNNPHNESRFIRPIEAGSWQNEEDAEFVTDPPSVVVVRGRETSMPSLGDYAKCGVELSEPLRVRTYEFCRVLASTVRTDVLANDEERTANVFPEMKQVLQLDEWNHPNVVEDSDRPSKNETFKQLAQVLSTGNASWYRPTLPPNTHWSNWPEGGTL